MLTPMSVRPRSDHRSGSRAKRARPAFLSDFNGNPIRPGDVVTVPFPDWSTGTAKWTGTTQGVVVSVGRTRVEVIFQGADKSHHVPARALRITDDPRSGEGSRTFG
jgi:hypothetical protein